MSGIQSVETRIAELMRLRRKVDEELARLVGMKPPRTRRSKFEIPECGTESAYQRHRYNGEQADEACRLAHNEHERNQAAIRRERARAQRLDEVLERAS